jgi:LacI family transcriptional regulator
VAVEDGAGPGRVTIRDVARAANVHISTVSRALDPEKSSLIAEATRKRVLAAADELGYRPHLIASGLRRGQTRTVGVVVPDLANPIYAPFTRGATHGLDQGGFMPLVADTEDDHTRLERILRHLAERRVEAIIITAARNGDAELLQTLVSQGLPVITAVRTLPGSGLPSVIHDDEQGGRLVAEFLAELGHRRVGQIRGPLDVAPFRGRTIGFAAAVAEAGLELVADVEPATRPTVAEGERLTLQLLRRPGAPPTALFAQNDVLAVGALKALRELGLRCPQDVSIVGYNDADFAEHTGPPLTTVKLSSYEIGRQAGELALEVIQEPDREHVVPSIPPELVVRGSTAPPPA